MSGARAGAWLLALGLFVAGLARGAEVGVSVIPAPASVVLGRGEFVVSSGIRVEAAGGDEAQRVAEYFAELAGRTAGASLTVVAPGSRALNRPAAGSAPRAITFRLDSARATAPESYSLEVTPAAINVTASTSNGLFYGAVTLWQLITAQPVHAGAVKLQAMRIDDAPRFKWRGLMLDVARHYMPPAFIKQLLDEMALHKLNTFHWHLTDDQGWRLEIKKYPRLTEVGAWRVPAGAAAASDIDPTTHKPRLYGGYYTQDEVRDIVSYAAARFITVVPEIEMPGHAQAAIAAYPQLGTEGDPPAVSSDWGVHNYLYNVDDTTFSFLEDVLTEVMALFPGQYIHIGGDEAAKDRWRTSAKVQMRMRELGIANEAALQGYFTHRMQKFLSDHGRRLIGWDEILEGGLPSDATVMSWRGAKGGVDAASQGHDVVMAPAPDLYLDYLQSDSADEPPGRPSYVTLADEYKFDVMPGAIAADSVHHILGAQLNAWTEHMRTSSRVQHAVFPRVAAFAENVWSEPGRRDWRDFLRRLPAQFLRYQKLGVEYADSAYEVRIGIKSPQSPGGWEGAAGGGIVALSNQAGVGDIRYTLNGQVPNVKSPLYREPITLRVPATVTAATFVDGQRVSEPRTRKVDRASLLRRNSDELKSCSNKLPLRLEDDAPRDGKRAVFNVDILDPCWVWVNADLSRVTAIGATVGQVPFNFQVGDDVKKIPLHEPQTLEGELEVRLDSCDGAPVASLPLKPATGRNELTLLGRVPLVVPPAPAVGLPSMPAPPAAEATAPPAQTPLTARASTTMSNHNLCLRFTRRGVDPIWAIDSVQLFE